MPFLVTGHPQDAVSHVVVLLQHVGEGVMHEIVGVLPLLSRAGVVPLPGSRMDFGVVHPVPLAVHDVVADLHVLEDLSDRQHGGARHPGRGKGAGEQGQSARHHELPLERDDAGDVGRVTLASGLLDVLTDGVELSPERLHVGVAEMGECGYV